ncbi:flagellar biosynthesis protein [Acetitomaculum ruminis DSM 5522]|uniref:Flagellar biosynthesis protein n=2 Tax=Acetitomaculum ruminis TaxID=2382 RepID=A0A1I0VNE0_9FIRM|nr:flagellar biosynthesis protein [Acetitomaculum ruminis DSM 5522]
MAVALRYGKDDAAPVVVASGKGHIAEKIIEEADKENVPTYKDEKLAATLSALEIGEMIPPELYKAVAQVLVFVEDMETLKSKLDSKE